MAIYLFAAAAGVALGLAYAAARRLLPSGVPLRTIVFTVGTTAFMLGQIVRDNREDFALLPVTLSLVLVAVRSRSQPRRCRSSSNASHPTGSDGRAGSRAGSSRSASPGSRSSR